MTTRRRLIGLSAAAPLAALAGCATHFQASEADQVQMRMQNPRLVPLDGALKIGADALAPGDILLSAANGATSIGIRLLTFAPVSHACLYVGDSQVAEAVGEGIRRRAVAALVEEEATVAAFRYPDVRPENIDKMLAFVSENVGRKYNFAGVMLQAPFSVERRLCELPLTPSAVRDICLQGVGAIQLSLGPSDRFFCSQFVLEAFRRGGLPLTDADPRLLSPADLMHMREGDVPSVRSRQALLYVGHLKYEPPPANPVHQPGNIGT
jgi:hypothetical protein